MKILLHIGRQKTGTTSIQRYLLENSDVLEEAGYYYSSEATYREEGHHKYASLLVKDSSRGHKVDATSQSPQEFSELFDFLRPDKINIISSEEFQKCDPRDVKKAFEGHEVSVVCYIRNELDALVSSYVQKVHASGYSETMAEYVMSTRLDYLDFLTQWSSVFGSEFSVRIFDKSRLHQSNVICDFFHHFLGFEAPPDAASFRDSNPSLTNRVLAFKLLANARRKRIPRIYKKLSILSKYDKESGKVRMTEDIKARTVDFYSANQKSWATKFFSEEEVFDYDAVETGNQYEMNDEEFMEHMALLANWVGSSAQAKGETPPPRVGFKERLYLAYRVLKGS